MGFEAYGKYFSLFNLTFVLLFIADAGLTNMLNRQVASKAPVNPLQLLKIKVVLVIAYVFSCFAIAFISGIQEWKLLFYLALVQSFTSLIFFLRNIITANQFFTADAWFSVLDKSLMILFCSGFIYGLFGSINLTLFLQLQILASFITLAALLWYAVERKLLISISKNKISEIVKLTAPFTAIILLMSLHYRLDGFLLERIHPNGAYEAGVYASAYRLLDAANMVGLLTATFLVPFIARNREDTRAINNVISLSRNSLLILAIGAILFIMFFTTALQQWLYYMSDAYINKVIQFTLLALPGYYMVHVYGSLLTATAFYKAFISILIVSVFINSTLNIYLISGYGAWGSAIAAISSQYFCGTALYIFAKKKVLSPK